MAYQYSRDRLVYYSQDKENTFNRSEYSEPPRPAKNQALERLFYVLLDKPGSKLADAEFDVVETFLEKSRLM